MVLTKKTKIIIIVVVVAIVIAIILGLVFGLKGKKKGGPTSTWFPTPGPTPASGPTPTPDPAQTVAPTCGAHGKWNGIKCVCDYGWTQEDPNTSSSPCNQIVRGSILRVGSGSAKFSPKTAEDACSNQGATTASYADVIADKEFLKSSQGGPPNWCGQVNYPDHLSSCSSFVRQGSLNLTKLPGCNCASGYCTGCLLNDIPASAPLDLDIPYLEHCDNGACAAVPPQYGQNVQCTAGCDEGVFCKVV